MRWFGSLDLASGPKWTDFEIHGLLDVASCYIIMWPNWQKHLWLSRSSCLALLFLAFTISQPDVMESTNQSLLELNEVIRFHRKAIAVICNLHYYFAIKIVETHVFLPVLTLHDVMWPWPYYLTRKLHSIFPTALSDECSQNREQRFSSLTKSAASISYLKTPGNFNWVLLQTNYLGGAAGRGKIQLMGTRKSQMSDTTAKNQIKYQSVSTLIYALYKYMYCTSIWLATQCHTRPYEP